MENYEEIKVPPPPRPAKSFPPHAHFFARRNMEKFEEIFVLLHFWAARNKKGRVLSVKQSLYGRPNGGMCANIWETSTFVIECRYCINWSKGHFIFSCIYSFSANIYKEFYFLSFLIQK